MYFQKKLEPLEFNIKKTGKKGRIPRQKSEVI